MITTAATAPSSGGRPPSSTTVVPGAGSMELALGASRALFANAPAVVLVGVEGSPSMGVTVTSSDPLRGGRPEWPDGTAEHISGEGIFVEEIHKALAKRGIGFPRVAGETHALAGHDEAAQRAGLESTLEG